MPMRWWTEDADYDKEETIASFPMVEKDEADAFAARLLRAPFFEGGET
jgi:hypothetical protein